MSKKVLLVILDGWGITPDKKGNAIREAPTLFFDSLVSSTQPLLLKASSQNVGLPWGEVGNSEVGHLNIGLGRVVLQDLPQIDAAIKRGNFFSRPVLQEITEHLKKTGGALHILGLASDGAVHAHINHFLALMDFANQNNIQKLWLHIITDGRDTPPKTAERFIGQIEAKIQHIGIGKIATVSGRYFAMDRDKHWDRVEKAYGAIVNADGQKFTEAKIAISSAYQKNQSDEFIAPAVIGDYRGIADDDGLVFTNYRTDRAIQITKALIDLNFKEFPRKSLKDFLLTTMVNLEDNLPCRAIFNAAELNDPKTNPLTNPLAKILSSHNINQLHLAETEKYAHITYFFNGGVREKFPGEEQIIIPSPKVATFDQQPEMSAYEVSAKLLETLQRQTYQFMVVNFANPDMVGHTGKFEAALQAVDTVDKCLTQIVPIATSLGFQVFVTADHGNADIMIDEQTGQPHKEHTINPVPLILVEPNAKLFQPAKEKIEKFYHGEPIGILADIVPTVLAVFGIAPTAEMTGVNLLPLLKK